jgi:hypothetical protein
VNWSRPLLCSLSFRLGPCSTMLQPLLYLSPCCASIHHWPKSHPSAPSGPDCPLNHQQKVWIYEPTTCVVDQRLLYSEKLNHPIWGCGPSSFPTWGSSCPAVSRHSHNGCLLCSSLYDQNLQLVLTIPVESASATKPTICTTLPKVDKTNTSLVVAPTAQTLVVRSGSKVSDDNLANDDPDLLNFVMVESGIACWMSSLL